MVFIPTGATFEVSLSGRAPRFVRCEQCGHEYVYLLEAQTSSTGFSPLFLDNAGAEERAGERAARELHQSLAHDCVPVPCPACGRLQFDMIPQARRDFHRWMRTVSACAAAVGGLLLAFAIVLTNYSDRTRGPGVADSVTMTLWASAATLLALSLALPLLRHFLARRHDPNAVPVEVRIRRGQELSVSKQEFYEILREQQQIPCKGCNRRTDPEALRPVGKEGYCPSCIHSYRKQGWIVSDGSGKAYHWTASGQRRPVKIVARCPSDGSPITQGQLDGGTATLTACVYCLASQRRQI